MQPPPAFMKSITRAVNTREYPRMKGESIEIAPFLGEPIQAQAKAVPPAPEVEVVSGQSVI